MTTLDSKQMELILAMIKHIGAPSGKEAWQEIADKLTDKPPAETCRSRWRGIEAKMKNGLAANGGDTGSQISVKKPKSTPRKKSAAKGSGKPTVKKPQGKKVMVAKDEDHDEGGDDDNLQGDFQVYEDASATEKRTFDEYANDGYGYGYEG